MFTRSARGMSGWAVACLIVMSAPAQPPPGPVPGILEGSRLVLRGAGGAPYLTIEQAESGNVALAILDRSGVGRVELSLLDDATPRVLRTVPSAAAGCRRGLRGRAVSGAAGSSLEYSHLLRSGAAIIRVYKFDGSTHSA